MTRAQRSPSFTGSEDGGSSRAGALPRSAMHPLKLHHRSHSHTPPWHLPPTNHLSLSQLDPHNHTPCLPLHNTDSSRSLHPPSSVGEAADHSTPPGPSIPHRNNETPKPFNHQDTRSTPTHHPAVHPIDFDLHNQRAETPPKGSRELLSTQPRTPEHERTSSFAKKAPPVERSSQHRDQPSLRSHPNPIEKLSTNHGDQHELKPRGHGGHKELSPDRGLETLSVR